MEYNICTKIEVNSVKVTWDILNFTLNGKNMGEVLKTSRFKVEPNKNATWLLNLYPKGYSKEDSGFVSLFIGHNEKDVRKEVDYSLSILDSKGNEVNTYKEVTIITDNLGFGNHKFISISDIKKYLINDKLTIVCKIRARVNIVEIPILPEPIRVSTDELSQDFQVLFENQRFTDVILAVKNKSFNAHKVILSARSPVFTTLFENSMKENIIIDIKDAEPNVIEEMLRFIYTGKVKDLNLIASQLLKISDRYSLEGLKSICEDTLGKILSVENVLKILSLADLHHAKTLKKKAVEFCVIHAKEIIQTAAFKSSTNLNVHILSDLFQAFALKQDT